MSISLASLSSAATRTILLVIVFAIIHLIGMRVDQKWIMSHVGIVANVALAGLIVALLPDVLPQGMAKMLQ